MPLKLLLALPIVFVLAGYGKLSAQHDPYEILFNGTPADEVPDRDDLPFTSEELFFEPLSGDASLFDRLMRGVYSPVRYSRGGTEARFNSVTIMGIDVSGNLNTAADYNLLSAAARSQLAPLGEAGAGSFAAGSVPTGRMSYEFVPAVIRECTSVAMFATDRKGRLGLKALTSGVAGRWSYMADIYRRWGSDATVEGVFTDRIAYSAGISGSFGRHTVAVFSAGDRSEDGLRSYITGEAAGLAGDRHYNPSWGYYNGRVRSGKVAAGFVPLTVLSYSGEMSGQVDLSASVAYRGGESAVSGLSWLDAATPYPDYYRYMPSYASSDMAEEIIRDKWAAGDMSVRQIDWDGMYGVNALNSQTAVYTLSERGERTREKQATVSLTVKADGNTTVGINLHGISDDVRRFRRMKDLLGGMAPEDIDQYLYEDEIYGDKVMNDVNTPYRKVSEGDTFGYDYDIFARRFTGMATVDHTSGAWKIYAVASYGLTTFERNGRFEKEIYPGALSYGRSGRVRYETFTGEVRLRYAFDASHSLSAYGYGGTTPQQWAVHFITPMYSNSRTGVSRPVTTVLADGGYSYRGRILSASASFFYSDSRNVAETYGYWDDIASVYSMMLLEGVRTLNRGIELAADYDITPRWNLSALFSASGYKYAADPQVTIFSENTLESYVSGAVSYLKGYRTGISPETFFNTRFKYSAGGFAAMLAANYAGGRYVSPGPLRRMQRAYNLASSAEGLDGFLAQEELGDAFTIDLSLLKSFSFKGCSLSLFLTVNNLLDNNGIVYGAYEQLRIARRGSGVNATWTPFTNKYLYGYGRSYYFSITFGF